MWKQFLPLSLSDVTMAFGDPAITGTLAQLPNARINIAAVGVAKALAVFFESPIIMLLHASNSLAGSERSRKALWRFTLLAITVLSMAMVFLALPPIFGFIARNIFGIPSEIEQSARLVLTLMIAWPAAIAWRRYYQGILIHSGRGNTVARAGLIRLVVVAGVLAVGFVAGVPGALLAGLALVGGILSEAFAVTVPAKNLKVDNSKASAGLPSNIREVFRFYWPLANSMMVVWGGRALLIAVIARAVDGTTALAVWPAAWGLVLLVSNSTRMIQQVIIRNRADVPARTLAWFVFSVGGVASAILLLLSTTLLGRSLVSAFVGFDDSLFQRILPVLLLSSIIPMLVALQNAVQGLLIGNGRTQRVNIATWVGTGILLGSAMIAVNLQLPGATSAVIAMVLAMATETAVLGAGVFSFRKPNRRQIDEETGSISFSGVRA